MAERRDRLGNASMLFAYFTPEVTLPVASALAAVFGFLLMVGRAPFRLAARGWRSASRRWKTLIERAKV